MNPTFFNEDMPPYPSGVPGEWNEPVDSYYFDDHYDDYDEDDDWDYEDDYDEFYEDEDWDEDDWDDDE